jgi:hypothetical protein
MQATKSDFLRHIGYPPPENRDRSLAYVRAIEAVDPDLRENGPLLDTFEKLLGLTLTVTNHDCLMKIQEKAVRHAVATRAGGITLPPAIPLVPFRHSTEAFENFVHKSIRFRFTMEVRVDPGALSVLQTIFEALQDGVVTPIELDGRDKLRLHSPTNGVACEIFVNDTDAVGMPDSAGEDDDTEDEDTEDEDFSDGDDSSDDDE